MSYIPRAQMIRYAGRVVDPGSTGTSMEIGLTPASGSVPINVSDTAVAQPYTQRARRIGNLTVQILAQTPGDARDVTVNIRKAGGAPGNIVLTSGVINTGAGTYTFSTKGYLPAGTRLIAQVILAAGLATGSWVDLYCSVDQL